MAVLRAACPSCGAAFKVTDPDLVGSVIDCPKCGEAIQLPDDGGPAKTQPRKKGGKKKAPASSSKVPLVLGGVAFLALAAVAVYFAARPKKDEAAGPVAKAPPPGVMDGRGGPGEGGRPGPQGTGGPPAETPKARPGEKLFPYDVAKLGYDPAKPDHVIPALQWPRRAGRDDQSLLNYNDKVIVTEGRIVGFSGTETSETPGVFTGPLRVSFNLFDAGGQMFGADGRAVAVGVQLPPGADWKPFRPGQVVKVAGRGRTPKDVPTSVTLSDAVVLSVMGDGDPPMTTEQFDAAVRQDPKKYGPGFSTQQFVTLNAAVAQVGTGKYPTLTLDCKTTKVTCQISNAADLQAAPPKPGDTVTLITNVVTGGEGTIVLGLRGLYVPK